MTDEPFGLHTIGQILVPVTDIDRATAFYRDVLGMRFLYAYPGIAFFDCDGVRLYLASPVEAFRGRAVLYFKVPSVQDAFEALTARGATAVSQPGITHRAATHDLWMAFVRDPDDNRIGLMAEVPKAT